MMKMHCFNKLQSLATLLMLFIAVMPTFAQEDSGDVNPPAGSNHVVPPLVPVYAEPTLEKTDDGRYRIASAEDYETFLKIVASGNPYANAVLEQDITVKDAIGKGAVQFHYRGTFDGQGHTICMDNVKNTENKPWGLFQYTEPGCVIRNLKVSGTITSTHEAVGSIVGEARYTTIENCVSDATVSGVYYAGGLVGAGYGVNFIRNCAFIGKIKCDSMLGCEIYGIIGYVNNNVEIKSCYVDADLSFTGSPFDQFMKKTDKGQTFLNNYYCQNGIGKERTDATSVSKDDITSGKLCLDLNINGKGGVVWYQHKDQNDNHPYPFKGTDCLLVTYADDLSTPTMDNSSCSHSTYENDICSLCGEIRPDTKIDPLQDCGEDKDNTVYVGNIRYTLHSDNNEAWVKRIHKFDDKDLATGVYVPETIRYNKKDYTVTKIDEFGFDGSKMEYCYIPKTVKRIEKDAFNGCGGLKYLHIADCPSTGESGTTLWMDVKTSDVPDEELFHDCDNLHTVYIGRDLRWDTADNIFEDINPEKPDEPFEDRDNLTNVFFGPRVSRVGNYFDKENPKKGFSYDLFNDCDGIISVFVMGDEQSLNEGDIKFYSRDGLAKAYAWYINRTIGYTDEVTYTPLVGGGFGCVDNCMTTAFGPFVKKIPKKLFSGFTIGTNDKLRKVDITKAFNLEEVGDEAFSHCGKADFGELKLSITKMKKIGVSAFQDCDYLGNVTIPASVEEIGKDAFYGSLTASLIIEDSDKPLKVGETAFRHDASSIPGAVLGTALATIYQGRTIDKPDDELIFGGWDELGTLTIGPKVTKIEKSTYEGFGKIGALSIMHDETPLELENNFHDAFNVKDGISSIFLDREMKHGDEHLYISTKAKQTMIDLSIGYHQTSIPSSEFNKCTALKTLVIPASVNTIGESSFEGCTSLENVFIAGDKVTVNTKAFNDCNSLKNLYMIGSDLELAADCFAGCKNIKQVFIGLTKDPEDNNSSADAFAKEAYDNAYLSSLKEASYDRIDFKKAPWSLFGHRGTTHATNDFDYDSTDQIGEYEHASIKRSFKNEKAELINIPFEMDPYYFGSDVEIYSLPARENNNTTYYDGTCTNTLDEENVYKEDVTPFAKVDVKNSMTIPAGVYLVKTKRDIENMPSHLNLFKSQLIAVDNTEKEYIAYHSGTAMEFGGQPKEVEANNGFYVSDGGVIKLVTGDYTTSPCQVVMEEYLNDHYVKQMTYDIVDEESHVLLSSKSSLGFNKNLEGYTTFYDANNAYIAPKWCEVYVVTSALDGTVNMEQINDRIINKGQAVIIKSSKDVTEGLSEYLTYVTNDTPDPLYAQNLLKGVSVNTPANQLSPEHGFVYVLSCNSANTNTGFYKLSGEREMPAGKAYLDPSSIDSSQLSKACLFICGDRTADGIQNTNAGYDSTESMYDLLGRKIKESGFKGIYILNNKKVICK